MKKIICIALGLLTLTSVNVLSAENTTKTDANTDTNISIMTFNVRYGTAKDEDNSWPYRKFIATEVIERYMPNLFGVQECS